MASETERHRDMCVFGVEVCVPLLEREAEHSFAAFIISSAWPALPGVFLSARHSMLGVVLVELSGEVPHEF